PWRASTQVHLWLLDRACLPFVRNPNRGTRAVASVEEGGSGDYSSPIAMNERRIADDVMIMSFPWRTLGIDFRRNVTLLRLADGRVVVHSTAPFTEQDIAAIRRFGEPSWLVEATLMHDTFAKQARAALPDIPYFAPDGCEGKRSADGIFIAST